MGLERKVSEIFSEIKEFLKDETEVNVFDVIDRLNTHVAEDPTFDVALFEEQKEIEEKNTNDLWNKHSAGDQEKFGGNLYKSNAYSQLKYDQRGNYPQGKYK
mmetsp:Transcript_10048/g.11305  ORF Transcript_10048/g.11305 Transcript_10048/m.11305 type:complete len:102 (-) Transcript_10048:14-319(-)